jgi:hypothetical protein
MKKTRLLVSAMIILFFLSSNLITAQTKQMELHATCNDYVFCLEKVLTGYWTYHFSYHVNKKTGELENVHWNIKHAKLVDSEGNRYKVIDTGNDNLGYWWDMFNYLNELNAGWDVNYTHEDGFLDPYLQGDGPEQGRAIQASFKFIGIGTGEKFSYTAYIRGYRNDNGDLILEIEDYSFDCNW